MGNLRWTRRAAGLPDGIRTEAPRMTTLPVIGASAFSAVCGWLAVVGVLAIMGGVAGGRRFWRALAWLAMSGFAAVGVAELAIGRDALAPVIAGFAAAGVARPMWEVTTGAWGRLRWER
jgi:hypothetical protein